MIADPALRARLDDASRNEKALSFTRKQLIDIAVWVAAPAAAGGPTRLRDKVPFLVGEAYGQLSRQLWNLECQSMIWRRTSSGTRS